MEQATGARRAAVAMSGGVDSSVAALLLAQAGWACTGVTLRLYADADAAPDGARTCCSLEDVEDARAVARRLGIRHYTFNFTEAFERDVIGRFVQGYLAGETPNPCIDCNKHIKFSALLRRAQLMGCTHVATGHYARIVRGANGRMLLQTGLDAGKDQSYMLYGMTQRELAHTLFPLGALTKAEVRALALETALATPASGTARTSALCRTAIMPPLWSGTRAAPVRRGISWMKPDASWDATGDISDTPWASAGAWALLRRSRCMCAACARRATPLQLPGPVRCIPTPWTRGS